MDTVYAGKRRARSSKKEKWGKIGAPKSAKRKAWMRKMARARRKK